MWSWTGFVIFAFAVTPFVLQRSRPTLLKQLSRFRESVLVFAHPDDETMFFLPIISMMSRMGLKFRLLCLSTGDYDGLGEIRVEEFRTVCKELGSSGCDILDDPKLRDGPHLWDHVEVNRVVTKYLTDYPNIDSIFTFDARGVSGHPNHISVYKGVQSMKSGPIVYTLKSEPLWRKYLPPVDFLIKLVDPTNHFLATNFDDPLKAVRLMKLYRSQNVWFRKLFSVFSIYSYVNEFSILK
jgi:N-acetylglucosaminylphosphatidylinositol deacetylase